MIVTQLQHPLDAQDAIHQTIKFSLFATGLLITVTAIILACTSLPREIDNRVIYTVVTKPTTRLEIVCGKVLGFAKVSAMILLIMGLFTFGYLHVRAWTLGKGIEARLREGTVDTASAGTLEHYRQIGLLTAKSLRGSNEMQIYSRLPQTSDGVRYMLGNSEGALLVPFSITRKDLIAPGDPLQQPGRGGLY